MNIEDTYDAKEFAQKVEIVKLISNLVDQSEMSIVGEVDKAFKAASDVWRDQMVNEIFPGEARKRFEHALRMDISTG